MTPLIILAWAVIGIQLIKLIGFLMAFTRSREQKTSITPPVSVIICAHDEEKNVRELVPALLQQDYPDFEVIVVEDRSNDGTYDFLREEVRKHPKLKMVNVRHLPEHVNGKKFALTLGIKSAVNDWVLLTDADCRPAGNGWIRAMAPFFEGKNKIVLGYSPYVRSPGYLNIFIRFEALVTAIQFLGKALAGRPYMGTGRNLAYRKELFIANKGFNKHLQVTGGDDDLFVNEHATKENTAVCIDPDSLMRSFPKTSWKEFLHQKLRHLSAGKHYRFRDRISIGTFSITWILSWLMVFPMLFLLPSSTHYLWVGFLVRELLLIAVVHRVSRTLGDAFESWITPLLDFNYAIYYLGTGLVALVSKRVRWKI